MQDMSNTKIIYELFKNTRNKKSSFWLYSSLIPMKKSSFWQTNSMLVIFLFYSYFPMT